MMGALLFAGLTGPLGIITGAVVGGVSARVFNGNINNEISSLKELSVVTRALGLNLIGVPINFFAGKKVVDHNKLIDKKF